MKKGGQAAVRSFFVVTLFIVAIFLLLFTAINMINGGLGFDVALGNAWDSVSSGILYVTGPIFSVLLDFGADSGVNFLKVLTFVLISIIIVGTLDSVNVFGAKGSSGANLTNFAVGIIVSLIGVRFMPPDMWLSLTAPSSAFVATVLVGAPFLALFFVTMKIRYGLATKLLWLFYVIFMSYLIFFPGGTAFGNDFSWIYLIFLIVGVVMLLAEGFVRAWIFKQSGKHALLETLGFSYAERMAEIEARIPELIKGISTTRSAMVKGVLQKELDGLKQEYKDISGKAFT